MSGLEYIIKLDLKDAFIFKSKKYFICSKFFNYEKYELPDCRINLFSLQSIDLITFEDIPGFQTRQDYKQTHLAPTDES